MAAARPTLLLIDRDPDILSLMELVFRRQDYRLLTTPSPEEGLRLLGERRVDCVLIDIHFAHTPECFGFLCALARLGENGRIPVLATSAMTSQELVEHVLDLGVRKFIPKPFYPGEILDEVRSATA